MVVFIGRRGVKLELGKSFHSPPTSQQHPLTSRLAPDTATPNRCSERPRDVPLPAPPCAAQPSLHVAAAPLAVRRSPPCEAPRLGSSRGPDRQWPLARRATASQRRTWWAAGGTAASGSRAPGSTAERACCLVACTPRAPRSGSAWPIALVSAAAAYLCIQDKNLALLARLGAGRHRAAVLQTLMLTSTPRRTRAGLPEAGVRLPEGFKAQEVRRHARSGR